MENKKVDMQARERAVHSNDLEELTRLAHHKDWEVRHYVALNSKVTIELLDKLATDEDYSVRANVAMNVKTSIPALLMLSSDKYAPAADMAAKNLKGRDVLDELLFE